MEKGSKIIVKHFQRFGLTVHFGNNKKEEPSKTEIMFLPKPNNEPDPTKTNDIILNEDGDCFTFTDKFKYLGTMFTTNLKDDYDIQKRIQNASKAFGTMKNVLTNNTLDTKIRIRVYDATVINILLWGCESWALTTEHLRQLEVCHHRFLRKMAHITIYDVKELHIKNREIRNKMGCYNIDQIMELRTICRLDKITRIKIEQFQRQFIHAWTDQSRTNRRPQKTMKQAFCKTLQNLNINTHLNQWITLANKPKW